MIRPTQARISLPNLRRNLGLLRSRLNDSTRVMAVVKANSYGHGAGICVPALLEEGIGVFGIATVGEARELREMGVDARIVLLTTPFESQRDAFPELDLEPMISDRTTAEWLSGRAEAAGTTLRAHVYVDTGMTRNGSHPSDVRTLLGVIDDLPGLTIQGLASHFATSEETDRSYALRQVGIFDSVYREALDAGYSFSDVHIANSGGILNLPESHYTLVRPGLSLYGYHPNPDLHDDSGLAPVMSFHSVVTSVRRIAGGTSISYGRRYTTERESLIATIPVGYGDGYMRGLTGKANVLIGGTRYPVVGTICMDEVMVNLGDDTSVSVGDPVVLIGHSGSETISGWELASECGTIPYEITSNVSGRVPRVVLEEEGATSAADSEFSETIRRS